MKIGVYKEAPFVFREDKQIKRPFDVWEYKHIKGLFVV